MINEQFWKKLDRITNKKQSAETTQEFLKTLVQGYEENLEILILGVQHPQYEDSVNQTCVVYEGKKAMLYFTDDKHVKHCDVSLPVGSMFLPECFSVYARDVINNAMDKEDIDTLIFNYGSKHMYVIPKILFMMAMLAFGHLPDPNND